MLARDDKNSVLCEVSRDKHEDIAYSPYGYSTGGEGALGYNGERRETPGGRYLLGNGYRAFSPFLMRFHIPDNRSPFGDGGLNAYMYVMGDPVGYADETGHVPTKLGLLLSVLMNNGEDLAKGGRGLASGGRTLFRAADAVPANTVAFAPDDLLSGWTMSTGSRTAPASASGAVSSGRSIASTGRSGAVSSTPASPLVRGPAVGASRAPDARSGTFFDSRSAPASQVQKTASKPPSAQPPAPRVPKPVTKEQFKNMSSIARNDYLNKGGLDPTGVKFYQAPQRSALDVRRPDRDRFQ